MGTMYRDTGADSNPVPPAQLAMALSLQGYLGLSDSDAVEAAVVDLRWQMVLGCLGATAPPFSQGTLQTFRERLIAYNMDRRLLERTVELAKSMREFDCPEDTARGHRTRARSRAAGASKRIFSEISPATQ